MAATLLILLGGIIGIGFIGNLFFALGRAMLIAPAPRSLADSFSCGCSVTITIAHFFI